MNNILTREFGDRIEDKIETVLQRLKTKISQMPDNCHFSPAASEEEIKNLESVLSIDLPHSYRTFLKNFNGGFICSESIAKFIKKRNDFETAAWNSLFIFGTTEIQEEYSKLRDMNWKLFSDLKEVYPFIPFCRTEIQEKLVFILPLDENSESPVFDAFHEDPYSDWGILYNNFEEFLESYIAGSIKTIASAKAKTAIDFVL